MKTLLIILIFPYHIFGQTYSISSTEITDSVVQIFTKKFEFTDNNIIQKLIVQDLMAYELFDSIDCSYMKLLELKSDRELSGFAIDKNDLVEVHFIDYFSVYINENYKKADKGFDMLSDTMRANPLNGQVTWIVNGRGLNNRYFEFSDISSIEFIYNDQTNSLFALSLNLKNTYLNLENVWFLADDFKEINELLPFYDALLKLNKQSIVLKKIEFC